MPIVTWSNEYSVNVGEIDEQHKKLLELVNNLHASVESQIDKKVLKDLLVELVAFTRMHFETEERYMKEYGFPDLVRHHKEHRLLLRHMDDLVESVSIGKYPAFYSDYDVSTDWALVHIADCDKKLGEFLNAAGVY